MRIEGIAKGLCQGSFPVKMHPLWVNDHGYPVSVMYGDLFLYFPAFLRLMGFSLQTVYKIYVFCINLLTAYCSYKCSAKMSGNYKIGIVMSLLYTLSSYRLTSAIIKAALGEVTAMAFMPLVFLGLWQLFRAEDEKQRHRSAVLLAISYTGLLESHLLSFEMAVWFSVFYCLLNWKAFVRNLKLLVQTAITTLGVNLFYLVPMVDYMLTQDLKILAANEWNMQATGLFIPQLTQMFAFVPAGERIVYKQKLVEEHGIDEVKNSRKILWLVLISAFMTTFAFPWKALADIPKIGTMLVPYQFTMRFSVMTLTFGMMLGAYALDFLKTIAGDMTRKIVMVGICLLAVIHFASYCDMLLVIGEPTKVTSYEGLVTRTAVIAGEYVLEGTNVRMVNEDVPQTEEGMIISHYEKKNGVITLSVENKTGKDSYVNVPFFAYKGYHAVDSENGAEFTVWHGNQNVAMIIVPVDYAGEIIVWFEESVYWRIAELASLVTILGSIFCYRRRYSEAVHPF